MEVQIRCTGSGMMPLNQIIPLQGGLKELSDANYRKLKNQILTHGMVSPFMIWEGRCIDGHQRLRTLLKMKEEGILMPESFPKVDIEAPDIKSAKRILLAISSQYGKLIGDGLYEYMQDMEIDIPEMKESFEFDSLDFGDFEKEYFDENPGSIEGQDDVPEDAPTISKLGDIWHLGNHKIMCGDCTVWENIKGLMGNEIPEVLYTDPPYGIDLNFDEVYSKSSGNGLADRNVYKKIKNDSDLSQIAGIIPFINIFEKKVIWGCNYFAYLLPPSKCWLSWFKKEDLPADTFCDTELAWTDLKKHTKTFSVNWRGMIKEGETGQKRVHPNQKPILLAQQIFEYMEAEKNIVDLFLGSGSTLIACEKTNRKCFGMEIDPHYIDVIVKRFADFTHQSDNIYLERDGEKIPYSALVDLNPIL